MLAQFPFVERKREDSYQPPKSLQEVITSRFTGAQESFRRDSLVVQECRSVQRRDIRYAPLAIDGS